MRRQITSDVERVVLPIFKSIHLLWFTCLVGLFISTLWLLDPYGARREVRTTAETVQFRYRDFNDGYFSPIPIGHTQAPDKVALGKRLFFDVRLSSDNSIACSGCHDLNAGGADTEAVSVGVGGKPGVMNTPTVFNSSFNFVQFWDGRAATLEAQVSGPIHETFELNSSWAEIAEKLNDDEAFRRQFDKVYSEGINANNIADAIAAFEKALLTPNAPFDLYLNGEQDALPVKAQRGMQRFIDFGCVSCHQGINLGGNMFQRFGIFQEFDQTLRASYPWQGRFAITGNERDRAVFKVPSLRNVALTAPYFHDGSVETLNDAVRIMGRYQLGRELSDEDIELLTAFLESLTGDRPAVLND